MPWPPRGPGTAGTRQCRTRAQPRPDDQCHPQSDHRRRGSADLRSTQGTDIAGKTIVLYHHISDSGHGYTHIGGTTTDSHGFYEFTRAEGVVETNRSWFVRLGGTPSVHSRTVHERVAALVSLAASSNTAVTRHPVTFTGHCHPEPRVRACCLQEQIGSSDDWKTLKSGRLGPGSNYSIAYAWRLAGVIPSASRSAAMTATSAASPTRCRLSCSRPGAGLHDQQLRADHQLRTVGDDLRHAVQAGTDHARAEHAVTLCHRAISQNVTAVTLPEPRAPTGATASQSARR